MAWSFALINNRLAEIFFDKKSKCIEILGHTYVNESDYKSSKEQKWIDKDTKYFCLVYRKAAYQFKKGHEIDGIKLVTKDIYPTRT